MSERRNLVIARVGDNSLHPNWLGRPGEARNWDLIVNYFGDDPERYRGEDWQRIDSKGLKYPALHDLIRGHEHLIRNYDYIWLPDEDLACTCQDINRLFEICRQERIDLAQPALTPDSYFVHAITLRAPCFRLRYTSFVEIMAPCFSIDTLLKLLPTMKLNVSGWGLDDLWPVLLGEEGSVGIVDDVQIRHTRPVGGGEYYRAVKAQGANAWDERLDVLERYGIRQRYWTRCAIRPSGRRIPDGVWFLCLYGWGLLRAAPHLKIKRLGFPRLWLSAMYQQVKGRKR